MTKIDLSPDELATIERMRGMRAVRARRREFVAAIASRVNRYAKYLYDSANDIDIGSYSKLLPFADLTYTDMEFRIVHDFLLSAQELAEDFA